MKIFAVIRKATDPVTGDKIVGYRKYFVHESAARYNAEKANREMKEFQRKFKAFWKEYLPDTEMKDEENIKRLFGLTRPVILKKPMYSEIEPKPLRPFKVVGKAESEIYEKQKKEWLDREKEFLLTWMTEVGEKFYKDDDEYFRQRQKCVDKLCIQITGMPFIQLNQGEEHTEYRYATEFGYKEISVDERK